jgi:hypothetical protein
MMIIACSLKAISCYFDYVHGKKFPIVDCEGKVYVITGSSAGIGVETAREIARMGGTVILACRSKDKALGIRQDILETTKCSSSKVIVLPLDVSDLKSVRNFVEVTSTSPHFSSCSMLTLPLPHSISSPRSLHTGIPSFGIPSSRID